MGPDDRGAPSHLTMVRGRAGTLHIWFRCCAVAFVAFAVALLAGCSGTGVGVDIELDLAPDGSVEERVSVRGTQFEGDVPGWSQESSSTAGYSRVFEDPSKLPDAEAELLAAVLAEVSDEIGFVPVILDRSKIDVVVQEYLLFKSIEVTYRLPEIDFRPPHCLECLGAGRHDCLSCDTSGSLVCSSCSGEGVYPCDECEARGSSACQECEGAGSQACGSCESRGWRECFSCDGSGTDSWGYACWSCDGAGRTECRSCDGAGRLDCRTCGGTGNLECSACDGEGEVECDECSSVGSVPCEECDGQGAATCDPCGGLGSPTAADIARYEGAIAAADVRLVVHMPGVLEGGSTTSWRFSGGDLLLPDEVRTASRVPNWPLALGSGGGVLVLALLGVTLSVRRFRQRGRTGVSDVVGESCTACGAPLKETASFCTECGARR